MNKTLKYIKDSGYIINKVSSLRYDITVLEIEKVNFYKDSIKLNKSFPKTIYIKQSNTVSEIKSNTSGANHHYANHKGPFNLGIIKDKKLEIEKCNIFYIHTSISKNKKLYKNNQKRSYSKVTSLEGVKDIKHIKNSSKLQFLESVGEVEITKCSETIILSHLQ